MYRRLPAYLLAEEVHVCTVVFLGIVHGISQGQTEGSGGRVWIGIRVRVWIGIRIHIGRTVRQVVLDTSGQAACR